MAGILPVLTDPATRLMTLTGPGVGKTRLAVELAAEALDAFPDGAFFVDLAAAADPAAGLPAVAAVLGVREGGGRSLGEATLALLGSKRVLLLLDNLEQIRPADALGREIAELLGEAPTVTVLATSRAPLRVRAEREWPVGPLAVPDPSHPQPPSELAANPAVALFLERARAVKPSFALTEDNADAVAEIVRCLDGLPLALELAAARLRVLSPSQLRNRLGTQLDLLVGAERDRPDRQQTLRATIRWSHDLLTPEQQALFRRLGAFAGGFSLEAVEALTAELGVSRMQTLDGLTELLAESLVRAEKTSQGEVRYRMLETIRAYAIERLVESSEADAARAAHLRYLTRWAEVAAPELGDGDRVVGLDKFETEHANLQAALGWAFDVGQPAAGLALAARIWKFWQFRAYFSEGRSWLDRLLAATLDEQTEDRTVGFEAAGVLAWNQGGLTSAEALLRQALALALERDDEPGRARILNNLGNVRNLMGDLDGTAAHFTESLKLDRALGDCRGEAIVLNNLALIAWLRQDLAPSIELLEQALAIERETDNPVGIADALGNLAQVLAEAGELDRAVALHRESLVPRRDVRDWLSTPYSLEGIAAVAVRAGLLPPAVRLMAASDALREETGAPIPATDRATYDEVVHRAKSGLGKDVFSALWREGGADRARRSGRGGAGVMRRRRRTPRGRERLAPGGHQRGGREPVSGRRDWHVLLIGAASGVGITETDDFQIVLEPMTTPAQYPVVHLFRTDPDAFLALNDEGKLKVASAYSAVMAEALEAVIANHLEDGPPTVLEGDFLLSSLAAQEAYDGIPDAGRVRAFILYEEEAQIARNYQAREGQPQPDWARWSWNHSEWLRAEAARLGVPTLAARPWKMVFERALALLNESR